MQDFIEAIRERRRPGVTGEQGRAALELATRIVEHMEQVTDQRV
jgi:predicted dehydrogenase